jgi:hypothetical protein
MPVLERHIMPPDPPGSFPIVHTNEVAKSIKTLSRNAEVGGALVTVAIIDEALHKLLRMAMRPSLSNAIEKRIFSRPLYDIAPKADIAFAFNLIDEQTLTNIRSVKEIRDLFAHTRDPIHFNTQKVVKACKPLPGFKKGANCRELFNAAAVEAVRAIDQKTQELIFNDAVKS